MRCLLVDDEPGIREGLAALLRRKGHSVVTAGDGAAAAQALADGEFEVVVTDWRLPDGTAERYLAGCRVPVVAISGHPEEVTAPVAEVLTKPVAPAELLGVLARLTGERPAASGEGLAAAPERPLPRDVQRIAEAFCREVAGSTLVDDGTFVTLRGALLDLARLPALQQLGGDLRVQRSDGRCLVALRLCRDGRPDPGMAVVALGEPWPLRERLAIDCQAAVGTPTELARFADALERARCVRAAGVAVHFLNLPDAFRVWAGSHGRDPELPMLGQVGPRLPALFVDLWSNP